MGAVHAEPRCSITRLMRLAKTAVVLFHAHSARLLNAPVNAKSTLWLKLRYAIRDCAGPIARAVALLRYEQRVVDFLSLSCLGRKIEFICCCLAVCPSKHCVYNMNLVDMIGCSWFLIYAV